MPNARDAHLRNATSFLFLGNTGAGKTTLASTFPGKKFAYLFDPNALNSLVGLDIEYEEFLPDPIPMGIVVQVGPWKGDKSGTVKAKDKLTTHDKFASETYIRWEEDFYKKESAGFFDQFDCIIFESITTFSLMALDRIMEVVGKSGQIPETDEYVSLVNTVANVFRTLTGMGKSIIATGHVEMKQDEATKKIFYTPLMTGQLRQRLPLLFSNIWHLSAEAADASKNVRYQAQTKPTKMVPLIRNTIRGVEFIEDVTLNPSRPREEQGLGAILKRHNQILSEQSKTR